MVGETKCLKTLLGNLCGQQITFSNYFKLVVGKKCHLYLVFTCMKTNLMFEHN